MEYLNCPICNKDIKYQLVTHLKTKHNLSLETFLKEFPANNFLSSEMESFLSELNLQRKPVSNTTQLSVYMGDKKVSLPFNFVFESTNVPDLDPHYIFPKAMYYVYEGIKTDHVYIYGETGLGKTDGVYQLAALLGKPVKEINMTGETTPENFLGQQSAENGTTRFNEGILLECMEKGYWLLADELDWGQPNLLSVLHNVMQFGFIYVSDLNRRVHAHPNFRIIGTANTAGTGDETGFYQGTNRLNRALIDRFGTSVEFEFPTITELKEIIQVRVGEFNSTDQFLFFVTEMRKAVKGNQVYMPFGVRSAIKFAKKLKADIFTPWESACLSFANMADSGSKEVIKGLVQRCFGS